MRIALFGYGKMGKTIEELARQAEHEIVLKTNSQTNLEELDPDALNIDVAIEFSTPAAAYDNIIYCLKHHLPVISGSTGWLDKLPAVKQEVARTNGTFLYAANFSLGVNLFFKLNKWLAQLLGPYDYSPAIKEIHHIHKLDAPSGTAIELAVGLVAHHPGLNRWVASTQAGPGELPVVSVREGEVPGTHIITYLGPYDEITITHQARNRYGFAAGALAVAEWIKDKKGFKTMDDFLNDR